MTLKVHELTKEELSKTTLPDTNKPFLRGKFKLENHQLKEMKLNKETKKKEYVPICKAIWINGIKVREDTLGIELEVLFYYRKKYKKVLIPRSLFIDNNLQQLTSIGADLPKRNIASIIRFLTIIESITPNEQLVHKSLGWSNETEELTYLHEKSISTNKNKRVSNYEGEFDIKAKGTLDGWLDMMRKHVCGHTELEFMIGIGFSAVINSLLSKVKKLDTILIHLSGESSTGKTTSSKLAVSAFGRPDGEGLIKTFNSTQNAILKNVVNNFGVPMVFDESSSQKMNFTALIYQLAEGSDRDRLTKESELKEKGYWNTALISTGEHKLTEKSDKNNGLMIRVPEFSNVSWTRSAEHARAIDTSVNANHAIAGPYFVEYVLANYNLDELVERRVNLIPKIMEAFLITDNFNERIAEKFASVLLTIELFNEAFESHNVTLDSKAILKFIVENDQKYVGKRTMDQKALTLIAQFIMKNRSKFVIEKEKNENYDYYGTIRKKEGYTEVAVLKIVLDEMLRENNFSSVEVVMSALKKSGYLDAENGKNTRKRKIPTNKVEIQEEIQEEKEILKSSITYVLKLDEEFYYQVSGKSPLLELKKRKSSLSSVNRKILSKRKELTIDEMLTDDLEEELDNEL